IGTRPPSVRASSTAARRAGGNEAVVKRSGVDAAGCHGMADLLASRLSHRNRASFTVVPSLVRSRPCAPRTRRRTLEGEMDGGRIAVVGGGRPAGGCHRTAGPLTAYQR